MEEGKIGNTGMICIIVNAIVCKVFFTSVAAAIDKTGTATWYMTLISMVSSLAVFVLINSLVKAYPGKNIMEIHDEILGNTIGGILSLLFFLILLLAGSVVLREFTDATNVYFLNNTPAGFITGSFILGVVITSFLGLENIGRVAKLFSYVLLFLFIAIILLASQRYHSYRFYPILGYGLGETFKNGIVRSSAYGEIILLGIFAKSLNDTKDFWNIGCKSLIISGTLISIALVSIILSFPYFIAVELTDPLYVIASLIDYGRFFQRIEAVFIFTWNISTLIGITAIFYGAIVCYTHIFKIKDKKPIIISLAIAFYIMTMITPSFSIMFEYVVPNLRKFGWIGFYVPIFITYTIWFFFKRRKQSNVQKN